MGVFSGIIRFFEGRVRVYADSENKNAYIGFLLDNGIEAKVVNDEEKGGVYTEISPSLLKNIAPALDKLNIMVYIINIYGFKRLCLRYRKRYGLILGAVTCIALLWLSTLFVWRVDVEGTELLSKESIRDELSRMGVTVGARISDIDREYVRNHFLKEHPEISWAALNFNGTTAELMLKETAEPMTDKDESGAARLLVASESGVVRGVTVTSGVSAVKPGAVVKKGDVLITGLISGSGGQMTEKPPLRLTEAKGSVTAEVTRTVTVSVPFSEERSFPEREEKKTFVISVFGWDIPLGSTEGKTLEHKENVTVFGVIEIPIEIRVYSGRKTVTVIEERDSAQARLLAEKQLYKMITESLCGGELTYVKAEYAETEYGIEAVAEIGCLTEIAIPYKPSVNTE